MWIGESKSEPDCGYWLRCWRTSIRHAPRIYAFGLEIKSGSGEFLARRVHRGLHDLAELDLQSARQFQTMSLFMYEESFRLGHMGYGAAVAWVLVVMTFVLAAIGYITTRRGGWIQTWPSSTSQCRNSTVFKQRVN